jgi:nicotinamidase-related amidase
MAVVLLMIDVQKNMLEGPEPVPAAGQVGPALADILTRARAAGAPVVHIRNNGPEGQPDETGQPGWELVHEPRDDEQVVDKHDSDSFAGTALSDLLSPSDRLVVAGMQSEHCVHATALAALRRGYPVSLVRGAHATYDDDAPADTIAKRIEEELSAAGVTLVDPEAVTFA